MSDHETRIAKLEAEVEALRLITQELLKDFNERKEVMKSLRESFRRDLN